MADSVFNPGVQPNFARMAQLQRDIADECERIPNIPQITMGNDILEALHQFERRSNERMDARTDALTQEVRQLGGRIDQLNQQQRIR